MTIKLVCIVDTNGKEYLLRNNEVEKIIENDDRYDSRIRASYKRHLTCGNELTNYHPTPEMITRYAISLTK